MLHFYILLSTKSIVLLLYIFSTIFVSCSLNQHKRFKLYPKRGQILYDETDGAPSPNDYEFLVSEDGEDDIPDKLYEEILPDLPPHDLIFMGKNLGKVEPNFVTPKPLVTKFPHTKPPIEIPSYFVNDEDKFLFINSLHDTLFPEEKENKKNESKMESNNIQLKNKIGGQERNETTKLVVQDVSTNLNITSKNHEESNTFNNIPLKSKNLTSAVDEIIEKNKKIGTNSLGNDYNDDLSFDEALKLAEAEAMRVLDEDKKKEEEMKDRNTIKKLKETASLSEVFLSNKKDVEKFSSQITTTKSTLVKGEANINDILLSSLPDIRRLKTTTVSPLTTSKNEIMKTTISLKISENIFGSSNNNRITNSNSIQMVPNDRKNNLELTTISIIDNNNNNKKSSIHRISLQISSTTTAIPIIKVSKCPTLNAYRDGKPHPNTSRYCKTLIPGVPDDNTCRCRYLVGSRDSNNCPSSFLYLCKPTAGK